MTNILASLERCLANESSLQQQIVEGAAVIQHIEEGAVHRWCAMRLYITAAQLINNVWNRNLAWTYGGALAAANTQITEFMEVFYTIQETCQDCTYTAGIDVAVGPSTMVM